MTMSYFLQQPGTRHRMFTILQFPYLRRVAKTLRILTELTKGR